MLATGDFCCCCCVVVVWDGFVFRWDRRFLLLAPAPVALGWLAAEEERVGAPLPLSRWAVMGAL